MSNLVRSGVIFLTNSSRQWLKDKLIYRKIEEEKAEKIAQWTILADCVYKVQQEENAPQCLHLMGIFNHKKNLCSE
jgi:hypothetical protein